MGRLIDADAFAVTLKQISEKQGYAELYMNVDDVLNSVIDDLQGNALNGYENCPTVEAIPKDQYEARLKADMIAMLTELQLEIEEIEIDCPFGFEPVSKTAAFYDGVSTSSKVIQQKIEQLKGENKK